KGGRSSYLSLFLTKIRLRRKYVHLILKLSSEVRLLLKLTPLQGSPPHSTLIRYQANRMYHTLTSSTMVLSLVVRMASLLYLLTRTMSLCTTVLPRLGCTGWTSTFDTSAKGMDPPGSRMEAISSELFYSD